MFRHTPCSWWQGAFAPSVLLRKSIQSQTVSLPVLNMFRKAATFFRPRSSLPAGVRSIWDDGMEDTLSGSPIVSRSLELERDTPPRMMRWKNGVGLGDVRAVRTMLQRLLPTEILERILRDADYYSAVGCISTTRNGISREDQECLLSVVLTAAQRRFLSQIVIRISSRYSTSQYRVPFDARGAGPYAEPWTRYSYSTDSTSGELRLCRHNDHDSYIRRSRKLEKLQLPDVVWDDNTEQLRCMRREGFLEVMACGGRYTETGVLTDSVTVELSFYPFSIDYADFVLLNGF